MVGGCNLQSMFRRVRLWLLLSLASVAWAETPAVRPPTPQKVTPGIWLIPGGVLPNRQPDGNTVVFDAPAGLVVMDTGRHQWHREAILALARDRNEPIVAIVNSHWHLDHVSGNPALRAQYPRLQVYASNAIDGALEGFLSASAKDEAALVDDTRYPEETRADIRGDLSTIQNGAALRPDVVIKRSGNVPLGGRTLEVNLAPYAATSADVWLYDEKSRVAAVGDLVTLPVPYLDTACPQGWKKALAEVATRPFTTAIPGHGPVLTRAQFSVYRSGFEHFIQCSRTKEECAAEWVGAVRPLLRASDAEEQSAQQSAEYYLAMLRSNGGRSRYCEAPG
jgi:glyoxylase-like metal-dependent hydrolase (beta-lactamase superfamily II)